jgi:two-component system, NarL family, response regulator
MTDLLNLLLVEDDPLFRLGLATCLQRDPTIESVTEALDGETALDLVKKNIFDVVILDLGLPGLGGIETCRQLQQLYPDLPILILTSHPDKHLVLKLIEIGAKGYCLKGIDADKLVLAIRSISMGATWWDRNASDQIHSTISQVQESPICVSESQSTMNETEKLPPSVNEFQLTKRELEVLTLITQGRTNQQIAEILFITSGTVRVHVHAILQKLDVTDRTQAAILALQQNLIS